MKKILVFLSALCAVSMPVESQNSYGQILYYHPQGVRLTYGSTIKVGSPGYIMAGYHILPEEVNGGIGNPPPTPPAYNFYVDRTAHRGELTPPLAPYTNIVFQKEYSIYAGSNCGTPTRVYDCSGISIAAYDHLVQQRPMLRQINNPSISITNSTDPTSNASFPYSVNEYGLAGTCSKGCFFALLDDYGAPIYKMLYPVPDPTKSISKPIIIKASTTITGLNEFFICFRYDVMMQVLRITETGAIVWSRALYLAINATDYGILEPNAMIENPYGPELVFAGKATNAITGLNSGFMTTLPTNMPSGLVGGGIRLYNLNGILPGWFSSMDISSSPNGGPGFVIGGSSQPVNNTGQAWMLKIDYPSFNVVWSTLITPSSDNNAGNIVGIIERQNLLGNYEYYGVTSSQVGIIALKLDANGIPISSGESIYNAGFGILPSVANSLSVHDYVSGPGIAVFGTDEGSAISGGGAHYLTLAYFSGHSGCNSPTNAQNYEQPSVTTMDGTTLYLNGLQACEEFELTYDDVETYNPICGPYTSVSGGSNARYSTTALFENELSPSKVVEIYPNPSTGNSMLSYTLEEDSEVEIKIHNALGQMVKQLQPGKETSGLHELRLDFNDLAVNSGVYFVTVSANGKSSTQKIVYKQP